MSAQAQLGAEVLRDVSRSFYLSLRLLPSGFRAPASVGYLLARLSDTIADAGSVDSSLRVELLDALGVLVATGTAPTPTEGLWKRLRTLTSDPGVTLGEAVLLTRGAEVVSWLSALPVEAQEHVRKVIEIILTGQGWDLTRFAGPGVVRLQDDEELEGYTYQVAGCVGEFWTRIGFLDSPKFARAEATKMEAMGRAYGQGLQLINILRDVPEDLERGRCYLPGVSGLTPEELMPELSRWQERADLLLDQGLEYCDQLRGHRAGVASGLPVLLGKLTLARLRRASWDDLEARVKVTRSEVKKAGWLALRACMGSKPGRWRKACERLLEGN